MRTVLDVQLGQTLSLAGDGISYELQSVSDDVANAQYFGLEGSLESLRIFLRASLSLVEDAIANDGDTSGLEVLSIGPSATEGKSAIPGE